MMQQLVILGSTGSIGQHTLRVVACNQTEYAVYALVAHSNVELILEQIANFKPKYAILADKIAAQRLKIKIETENITATEILSGTEEICNIVAHEEVNIVMAGISGFAGLSATLAAVHAGKKVLLANKEALVVGGSLFMHAVRCSKATLIPVDSEHNGILQCLPKINHFNTEKCWHQFGVEQVTLTASGGPFLDLPVDQFKAISPEQACAHPNWLMGKKISVDSATMMNKGLEFIEACWLYNLAPNQVDIIIHPQSIIHAMVKYIDGSTLACMSSTDMCVPIANALAWPKRIVSSANDIDLLKDHSLTFRTVELDRFKCLNLALQAVYSGSDSVIVLNAANEMAVEAFLNNKINFEQIAHVIDNTLQQTPSALIKNWDDIYLHDQAARIYAQTVVNQLLQ